MIHGNEKFNGDWKEPFAREISQSKIIFNFLRFSSYNNIFLTVQVHLHCFRHLDLLLWFKLVNITCVNHHRKSKQPFKILQSENISSKSRKQIILVLYVLIVSDSFFLFRPNTSQNVFYWFFGAEVLPRFGLNSHTTGVNWKNCVTCEKGQAVRSRKF